MLCRNGYSQFFGRSARWDTFRYLIENFATFSGISGFQPKILVHNENVPPQPDQRKPPNLTGLQRRATHIVKFGGPNEFPRQERNYGIAFVIFNRFCGFEACNLRESRSWRFARQTMPFSRIGLGVICGATASRFLSRWRRS